MREQLATWPGRSANTADKRSDNATVAKDPLPETRQAESSAGGPSERLNVFEQFKIPHVDSAGKQSAVTGSPTTGTQNRGKVSGCSIVKKARLSSSSGDATSPVSRKKHAQLAQNSSVRKETNEVFGKFLSKLEVQSCQLYGNMIAFYGTFEMLQKLCKHICE